MVADYADLTDLKKKIIKYKETKDNNVFNDILLNVDKLLFYFIHRLRKQLSYLKRISLAELYNTSIIALHKACITYPDDMKHNYIPCRIRAYMKAEFRKTFCYLQKEIKMPESEVYEAYFLDQTTHINTDEIDYNLVMEKLTPKERSYLHDYLQKTKTQDELAEENGYSQVGVYNILRRAKAKLHGIID